MGREDTEGRQSFGKQDHCRLCRRLSAEDKWGAPRTPAARKCCCRRSNASRSQQRTSLNSSYPIPKPRCATRRDSHDRCSEQSRSSPVLTKDLRATSEWKCTSSLERSKTCKRSTWPLPTTNWSSAARCLEVGTSLWPSKPRPSIPT
jgi:hypothetical protein